MSKLDDFLLWNPLSLGDSAFSSIKSLDIVDNLWRLRRISVGFSIRPIGALAKVLPAEEEFPP